MSGDCVREWISVLTLRNLCVCDLCFSLCFVDEVACCWSLYRGF